jgi:hypothetical protein
VDCDDDGGSRHDAGLVAQRLHGCRVRIALPPRPEGGKDGYDWNDALMDAGDDEEKLAELRCLILEAPLFDEVMTEPEKRELRINALAALKLEDPLGYARVAAANRLGRGPGLKSAEAIARGPYVGMYTLASGVRLPPLNMSAHAGGSFIWPLPEPPRDFMGPQLRAASAAIGNERGASARRPQRASKLKRKRGDAGCERIRSLSTARLGCRHSMVTRNAFSPAKPVNVLGPELRAMSAAKGTQAERWPDRFSRPICKLEARDAAERQCERGRATAPCSVCAGHVLWQRVASRISYSASRWPCFATARSMRRSGMSQMSATST